MLYKFNFTNWDSKPHIHIRIRTLSIEPQTRNPALCSFVGLSTQPALLHTRTAIGIAAERKMSIENEHPHVGHILRSCLYIFIILSFTAIFNLLSFNNYHINIMCFALRGLVENSVWSRTEYVCNRVGGPVLG